MLQAYATATSKRQCKIYRKQGVDTRTLLGHKREEMTDKYNDDRDLGWKRLVVKKQSVLQKSFAEDPFARL